MIMPKRKLHYVVTANWSKGWLQTEMESVVGRRLYSTSLRVLFISVNGPAVVQALHHRSFDGNSGKTFADIHGNLARFMAFHGVPGTSLPSKGATFYFQTTKPPSALLQHRENQCQQSLSHSQSETQAVTNARSKVTSRVKRFSRHTRPSFPL
ncbi:hypothetical protein HZH66_006747 [Vespula vulgaris]|uniref:Uncharacterized protein n=1 Tax=Vespula vulgaris TaxID=7454 RepID=A0A834N6P8_VESVU|nr:hypothetical protein HZH66_006747 [Vespula vulgaris]